MLFRSNTSRGFFRSLGIVYGILFFDPLLVLKYVLGLIPALLTGKVYKKPYTLWKLAGKDSIWFSLSLAFFISSYKGVLCALRKIFGNKRWISLVAGAFCINQF